MRKGLLFATALCLASSAMAQTSFKTALEAKEGENTFTVDGEQADSIFWQFTADKDYLAEVSPLQGSYDAPSVSILDADEKQILLGGAGLKYPSKAYSFKKGQTYYFILYKNGEMGFNLNLKESSNYGMGLTEDNPLELKLGEEQYLGDPLSSSQYDSRSIYATYKAEKDGQLQIALTGYISSALVNGVTVQASYDQTTSGYVLKTSVEAGKTYTIQFNLQGSIIATSKVVDVVAGSIEAPFVLKSGENTVPAAMGDYYFTYTPTEAGYLNLKSDAVLAGGQVRVYRGLSDITYGNIAASSATGSYDVRVEIPYTGNTYYIVVSKLQDTENADVLNAEMQAYQPGETINTPIELTTLPADQTLPNAKGTYYYQLSVPANTNKFVVVKTKADLDASTSIIFYNKNNGSYGAPSVQNGELKTYVGNTYDVNYILQCTSNEDVPLSFSISYEDVVKGSLITDPAEAQEGYNEITIDGTEYFSYTATKDGKLSIDAEPTATVSFPQGTDSWSGEYTAIVSGSTYSIEATKGTTYLIKISGAEKGTGFELEETEFAAGESRTNPIVMTGDTYTLGKSASNLWLEYDVKEDGILDFACDVPYGGGSERIEIFKNSEQYGSSMMGTETDGSDTNTVYKGKLTVSAGDKLYVHCTINSTKNSVGEPGTISFTQHEAQPGETISNPLVLAKGSSVVISNPSYTTPVWVKVELPAGNTDLQFNGYINGDVFTNLEDAQADRNGNSVYSQQVYADANYTPAKDSEGNDIYKWSQYMGEAGTAYFKFTRTGGQSEVKMQFMGVASGIGSIEAIGDNKVSIYRMDGTQVDQISGSGVYIIKSSGTTKKIVIKK